MSMTHDGQRVTCDGEGCQAEALLPVALRPVLSREHEVNTPHTDGWLFATDQWGWRHFCPKCTTQYLTDEKILDLSQSRETD